MSKKKNKVVMVKLLGDVQMPVKLKYGGWIDLSPACDVELKQFEGGDIPLGISVKLPIGYEALISIKDSAFNKYGIIQTNGITVIDSCFCCSDQQWCIPVVSLREGTTVIPKGTCICKFRIIKKMGNSIKLEKEESLTCYSIGSCDDSEDSSAAIQMEEDV